MKSDAQHVNVMDQMHNEFYGAIIHAAEMAAEAGQYKATIYGEKLDNSELISRLKQTLTGHGFKVSAGRTRGLGKITPSQAFLTISWK